MEKKYIEILTYFEKFNQNATLFNTYKKPSQRKVSIFEKIKDFYNKKYDTFPCLGTFIRSYNTNIFTTTSLCFRKEDNTFWLFIDYPTRFENYAFSIEELTTLYNTEFEKSSIWYDFALEDKNDRLARVESLRLATLQTMYIVIQNCINSTK